jgi:hypothetical protein
MGDALQNGSYPAYATDDYWLSPTLTDNPLSAMGTIGDVSWPPSASADEATR